MIKSVSNIIKAYSKIMHANQINPVIEVEVKSHYGADHVYVISEQKDALTTLTGSKTITGRHLKALKDLGFTIKEKERESKF